ncbi:MAG: BsuPI-related putative proteinase inhibitor [Candidatus Anammoxibacter sp.]
MFTTRLILGIFICLSFFININVVISGEFVPWEKGDNATYIDSFNNTTTVEVDGQIANWLHFTNFAGLGPLWIKTGRSDESVFFRSSEKIRQQILVDFEDPEGTKTAIDISPCNNGTVQIKEKEVEINVPAGIFNNVTRLDFETSCSDGGVTSAWFAPNAGVIKWESSNIAGIVTNEMIQSTIGDTEFPLGLVVNASFPDPTISIDLEPPVNPDRPVTTVNVFLTIKNNTGRELQYRFNSGQHFDIILTDADGKVASTWSRGRAFTEALNTLTLSSGKTLSFGGPIELSDNDGTVLPGGNYTLKIEMTSAPNSESDHKPGSDRISVTAPLTILLAL